jgi:hypothetical protein|tara:strand:+ start:235 stop:723 length:489 start_codon:yes stop_codon:yes gene_type:complete
LLLGITGDTHNNLSNISEICKLFNFHEVEIVIHTGDITLAKSLEAFSDLNMPLIGVFGNNDIGEKAELKKTANKIGFKIFEEPHLVALGELKILIFHHPDIINKGHIESVDAIFHGHTHRFRQELVNETLIFNPGECAGLLKGKNRIGLYETKTKEAKTISF